MADYNLIFQGHFERTDNPRDHTRNFVEHYIRNAEIPREDQEITVPRDYFNQLLATRNLQWGGASTPKEDDHVFRVGKVSHKFSARGLEHEVVAHYKIRVGEGD